MAENNAAADQGPGAAALEAAPAPDAAALPLPPSGGPVAAPGPEISALGHIDIINRTTISGWTWDPADPDATLQVEIYENDALLARVESGQFRADLARAGIGTGYYGFAVHGVGNVISPGPTCISVVLAHGRKHLRGSPLLLDAAEVGFSPQLRRRLDLMVGPIIEGAGGADDLEELYDFLQTRLKDVVAARTALAAQPGDDVAVPIGGKAAFAPIWSAEARRFLGEVADKYPVLEIPADAAPRVSIIIPCHNNFELTYRCVESILVSAPDTPFEIVLVDDGSLDETMLAGLLFVGAVRVVRNASALGFLRAANAGAAAAAGELLLFLNNDTELRKGALDELVRSFEELPDIGVAGSKLINTDGTLQESGGIIQSLGNGLNWGFGGNPADPKYCYLRDVDYVSGASLMIPRALFEAVHGFDETYVPAYYEDTDLCFKVREAGRRVVVQPLSEVVHHGGATSGTSVTAAGAPKRYQAVNQRKFLRKWNRVLAERHNAAAFLELDAERTVTRRAVFIDVTVPTPDRDAGSTVAWSHMRLLRQLGYKVSFIPADNMANIPPYTADLQRIGVECFYAPHTNSVEDVFRRMRAIPPQLIYFHRINNAAPYLPLARKFFPSARLVYSAADLHFLRLQRQAVVEDRPDLRTLAEALEREELEAARLADCVIVHSVHEAAILRERVPGVRVSVVEWPVAAAAATPTLRGRSGVAFVGGYSHEPNVDAAVRLAGHIMPLVRHELPDLRLRLIGADAPRRVLELASEFVEVVGHAPDLGRALGDAVCTVAPLRYGAGVKGKVLTSLALGLPCVMSDIAAEGIPLPASLGWLVGHSEVELAARIVALHREPDLAEQMSQYGLNFIRGRYGEEAVQRQLAEAIGLG